jgi:Thymidylate synthase
MVCTPTKPDEPAVQQACTSSIQLSSRKIGKNEELNLTVTQRSLDVFLGLPHDVIAWSIILHFCPLEVGLRTQVTRKLRAGMMGIGYRLARRKRPGLWSWGHRPLVLQ